MTTSLALLGPDFAKNDPAGSIAAVNGRGRRQRLDLTVQRLNRFDQTDKRGVILLRIMQL
jgi:hypothetical protein